MQEPSTSPGVASSPFMHSGASVQNVMLQVLVALLPGLAVYVWYFGIGILLNILLAIFTALLAEAGVLKLRHLAVGYHLRDLSAVLTAALLALALPPLTPWWVTVTSTIFAIVIAKQLFGGLGQNVFNPAMAGYAMALLAYPKELTAWIAPLPIAAADRPALYTYFFRGVPDADFDMVTHATPLSMIDVQLGNGRTLSEILLQPEFGLIGGLAWEWINIAFLAGGLFLLFRRLISWHTPMAIIASLAICALIANQIAPEHFPGVSFHLFNGAVMITAFFIATDPVTSPNTAKGQLICGVCIGVLAYIIRTWGAYPDGFAFAVLILNMFSPLIDQFTRPRAFGHHT